MNNIYCGNIPLCSDEDLAHHGIKGQKWGVRRFQNDDGSLTDAGKARYGHKANYSYQDGGLVRQAAKSSLFGANHLRENRVKRLGNKLVESKAAADRNRDANDATKAAMAKEQNKLQAKLDAQKAANANQKAYEAHTSTKKLVTQDVAFGKYGAQNYRHARARGEGRVRSLFEAGAGLLPLASLLRYSGDKKAYGKATWAGMEDGSAL